VLLYFLKNDELEFYFKCYSLIYFILKLTRHIFLIPATQEAVVGRLQFEVNLCKTKKQTKNHNKQQQNQASCGSGTYL
jgi:hypothetical protein